VLARFFGFFISAKRCILNAPVPSRPRYKIGRPTKRTKAVVKVLFDAIKEGVPFKLACMAAGITYESFNNWRQNDPDFDRQVEELVAKPAIDLFKIIREQAPENWQAGAWTLERRFPEMFAKPEAQLNIVATAQAAAINGTPHNVQTIIVSDLEFVGLKRHPAYTHRPGVVRQSEQVPPELDGALQRADGNIIVTSESRARATSERHARIHAETKRLLDACQTNKGSDARATNTGNGQGSAQQLPAASEPASSQVPTVPTDNAPAEEPHPTKPSSWWRPFIFGGAVIPKVEAILAVRLILDQLRITVDERALDFQTEQVAKSTFCQALEKLTGSDLGWRTMAQIYERAQARERLWAISSCAAAAKE
jgi:transposase